MRRGYMKRLIEWDQLRKIKEIRVIRSMYIWLFIVPVSAKALSTINTEAKLIIFNHIFDVNLTLPFSWKIFYFSALSFAIANVIYPCLRTNVNMGFWWICQEPDYLCRW